MRLRFLRKILLLPLLGALLLAACHGNEAAQPGGGTPEAAVQGSINLLKAGGFNGFWKHALPSADYANLRADWHRRNTSGGSVGTADEARFNASVQQLTGPDAERKLYAQVQPKLEQMQQQYKDQLPVLIAMYGAFLKNGVAQNPRLDPKQKAEASQLIDALTPWAQQTPWFDQTKAKEVVAVLVTTARKLDLKSSAQLHTLDFDAAMAKYATAYAGLKQALAIYGLSVDQALDSAKLSIVSNQNGHAVVKIDYTLLGKPLSAETNLVQQDGRWYSESLVDNVRKAHEQLQQPAAAASMAAR